MSENRVLSGTRIGVFGKGGAGKSTFTALFAMELNQLGYRVCVLDADSTNHGLARAMGMDPPRASLLDFFGGMVFSGGAVTCPVDDPTPLENAHLSLEDLSGEYSARNRNGIVLLTAGKIGGQGPGAGCDGPVSKIARDVIVHSRGKDPVTLIDFKAGFEDSARGVLTNLDWAVVVVDPTQASVEIAADLQNMINQVKADILPATSHLEDPSLAELANRLFIDARIRGVYFVLNRIPDRETGYYLEDKLAQKGIIPAASIPEDSAIPQAWLKGESVISDAASEPLQKVIHILEKNLENPNPLSG